MRRFAFAPAFLVAVALFTVAAGAAWLATGTGSSSSRSTNLGKPTSVTATATGTTSIQVTWQPPASNPAPSSYDVFRYNGATGTKVCTVAASSPRRCDATGLSPNTTYGFTVESRLGANWMSGQTAQVNATTNAAPVGTPNFLVEQVVAGNKTAGTAFQVRITARTGTTTDATYAGSKNLAFSGPGSNGSPYPDPSYPATGTFAAGVATVNVTLQKAETVTLTVAEGSSRSGNTSVTVVAGVANQLRFTSSTRNGTSDLAPCSPGGNVRVNVEGGSWLSKVSRYDASGNPVVSGVTPIGVSFSGKGTLTVPPNYAIGNNASETANSFTFTVENKNNPGSGTVTASSGNLTAAVCTVDK